MIEQINLGLVPLPQVPEQHRFLNHFVLPLLFLLQPKSMPFLPVIIKHLIIKLKLTLKGHCLHQLVLLGQQVRLGQFDLRHPSELL